MSHSCCLGVDRALQMERLQLDLKKDSLTITERIGLEAGQHKEINECIALFGDFTEKGGKLGKG